jgi:hypothetical protein
VNASKPETSRRLSRTLSYLKAAGAVGATSAELAGFTLSVAPGTDVSELRQNGYLIECRYEGQSQTGRKVYRYLYQGRAA